MKKLSCISVVAFLFTTFWSGICLGVTITVGPGGPGHGYDFESIQAAIDIAVNGDEIVVAPGTYEQAIHFLGKAVHLYSSGGPEVTIIDGTGYYHVIQCVSGEGAGYDS